MMPCSQRAIMNEGKIKSRFTERRNGPIQKPIPPHAGSGRRRILLSPRLPDSEQFLAAAATAKALAWLPSASTTEPLSAFREGVDAAALAGLAYSIAATVQTRLAIAGRLLRTRAGIGLASATNGHRDHPLYELGLARRSIMNETEKKSSLKRLGNCPAAIY